MNKPMIPANRNKPPSPEGRKILRAVSGHGTVHFYRAAAPAAKEAKPCLAEPVTDDELDQFSGGPVEVRELSVRTTVEKAGSKDIVLKGSKILQN